MGRGRWSVGYRGGSTLPRSTEEVKATAIVSRHETNGHSHVRALLQIYSETIYKDYYYLTTTTLLSSSTEVVVVNTNIGVEKHLSGEPSSP